MIILLHSSKTMRLVKSPKALRQPPLIKKAEKLAGFIKGLSATELGKAMKISSALAKETVEVYENWSANPGQQSIAMDSFLGDIYSGLQVEDFTEKERDYADKVLVILSGLYGLIRPLDGINPYRLEMGYKLPGGKDGEFSNLYKYWGEDIVNCIPKTGPIVNLSSEEFSKTITDFVDKSRVIAPKFLSKDPKSGEPKFVVVHAKIARGAFAHWMIKTGVTEVNELTGFSDFGYRWAKELSREGEPVFVCEEFGGKGLSIKTLK